MEDENFVDLRKKGGRKRKFPQQNESIRKILYNTGEGYYRKDGVFVNPKVFNNISKCCNRNCHNKFVEAEQRQIFQEFYSLGSFAGRSHFLNSCVNEILPARRTKKDERSRRGFTKIFTLSSERVCKTFFCDLLQISSKRVEVALKKLRDDDSSETVEIITSKPVQVMENSTIAEHVTQKRELAPDIINQLKSEAENEIVVESYVIGQEDEQSIVEYLEEESYTIEEEQPDIVDITGEEKQFDECFVCSCPSNCTEKLPIKARRQLYQMFWNIGTNDRKAFINCCVGDQRSAPGNGEISKRKFFLKGVEICEPTFTKTLMITSAQIELSLQNEDSDEEVDTKEKVVAHITEHFNIEPLLDYMYSNFNDENPGSEISLADYKEIFHEKFSHQLIEKESDPSPL